MMPHKQNISTNAGDFPQHAHGYGFVRFEFFVRVEDDAGGGDGAGHDFSRLHRAKVCTRMNLRQVCAVVREQKRPNSLDEPTTVVGERAIGIAS